MPKLSHRLETLQRWAAELERKRRTWKKPEINAVIKALQARNFQTRDGAVPAVHDAFEQLAHAAAYGQIDHAITAEQSTYGLAYLLARYYKKDGEPRASCPFGEYETHVLRTFKRFTFVGLYSVAGGSAWTAYLPVYRVHAKNGDWFDYAPRHWNTPMLVATGAHRARKPVPIPKRTPKAKAEVFKAKRANVPPPDYTAEYRAEAARDVRNREGVADTANGIRRTAEQVRALLTCVRGGAR